MGSGISTIVEIIYVFTPYASIHAMRDPSTIIEIIYVFTPVCGTITFGGRSTIVEIIYVFTPLLIPRRARLIYDSRNYICIYTTIIKQLSAPVSTIVEIIYVFTPQD